MTRHALRVLAAAALGISSYVHLHLAHLYPYPGTISGTQLFEIQGSTAAVLAVALLLTGNRWVWAAAAGVGLASVTAVLLYRYVNVGALGPLPNMNDGTWSPTPDKPASAVAEALVPLSFALELLLRRAWRARDGRRIAGRG